MRLNCLVHFSLDLCYIVLTKSNFNKDPHVKGFVNWAADTLHELQVSLKVSRRGTGRVAGSIGPGVPAVESVGSSPDARYQCTGIEKITKAYHWLSEWRYPTTHNVERSGDWTTTKCSLGKLGDLLRNELSSSKPNPTTCFEICKAILNWGGERAPERGARPFLEKHHASRTLCSYLNKCADTFNLAKADLSQLTDVKLMNAMLTKVHALAAVDGLPIYDTRVAGATGALVELYRRTKQLGHIPTLLRFRATEHSQRINKASSFRRRVKGMTLPGPVVDPGVIPSVTAKLADKKQAEELIRAGEWSSCKIRLGWLMEAVLQNAEKNGNPFTYMTALLLRKCMPLKLHFS